jgi:hypothetical protein
LHVTNDYALSQFQLSGEVDDVFHSRANFAATLKPMDSARLVLARRDSTPSPSLSEAPNRPRPWSYPPAGLHA